MPGRVVQGIVLALLVSVPDGGFAAAPAQRCAVAKNRAAAQKIAGKLRCAQRGLASGAPVDGTCLARVEQKFLATIARAEARGGCVLTGDAATIEAAVDACVGEIVALTPATTSTTTTATTSSSCPPSTAFYCGINSPTCGIPALCPIGMTCQTGTEGCECVGTAPACGSLQGALCRWGACPAGQTCGSIEGGGCPPACGCR